MLEEKQTRIAEPPEQFMLGGSRPRLEELFRVFRIASEFLHGFRKLHFTGPCVTVFGSARFDEENKWYQLARAVGAELGRRGFTVMTGGGPGIMEAANRGARDVNAPSIGCNIILPHEQVENLYCDRQIHFQYFFIRKVMLVKYSYGFVVMPGGFGTLDELIADSCAKERSLPQIVHCTESPTIQLKQRITSAKLRAEDSD